MLDGGTKDGLLVALLDGALYGTLGMIEYVLTSPVQGFLYCVVVWGRGTGGIGALVASALRVPMGAEIRRPIRAGG
jgi:hypothetical protein